MPYSDSKDLFQAPTVNDILTRRRERIENCKHEFIGEWINKSDFDPTVEVIHITETCKHCCVTRRMIAEKDIKTGRTILEKIFYVDSSTKEVFEATLRHE